MSTIFLLILLVVVIAPIVGIYLVLRDRINFGDYLIYLLVGVPVILFLGVVFIFVLALLVSSGRG